MWSNYEIFLTTMLLMVMSIILSLYRVFPNNNNDDDNFYVWFDIIFMYGEKYILHLTFRDESHDNECMFNFI